MNDKEQLSFGLRGILEEFSRIRDTYVALKAYCEAHQETLTMEKERSERIRNNLEMLSRTYSLLEERYKIMAEKWKMEKEELHRTIGDLRQQCDHLRLVVTDHNGVDQEVCRLKDEIDILKTKLMLQEEKHTGEVAILKQQHSNEIHKYKVLLQNAKLTAASNENKKRGRQKNPGKNKKNTSLFRWPELDVERISTPTEVQGEIITGAEGSKKRKLYREEIGVAINIVQSEEEMTQA
nr:uncharacterized protein LOC116424864 [Nomia melanderi]